MSGTSTAVHPPDQLTPDEIRILEECDRESLIYRSLPLGILSFTATQYAMTRNIISTKAKWLKLGASLFAGYMIGKVSYTFACRKKILTQIPDSSLAQLIHGVESRQISPVNIPEPTDTHSTSADINQYGDPIYKTNK
jgi:hypothetical protein